MQPVSLTCQTDRTEVALQGTLDVREARAARATLNEALVRALPLELDAARLERIDAAGLQLLLAFLEGARARGVDLRWRAVSAALATSAELLGLSMALGLPR